MSPTATLSTKTLHDPGEIESKSSQALDHSLRFCSVDMGTGQNDTVVTRHHREILAIRVGRAAPRQLPNLDVPSHDRSVYEAACSDR